MLDNDGADSRTVAASAATALPVRGREQEIAALRAAVDGVRGGRSRCALLEGAPGVGKSRLLSYLDELARQAGFDVLWVRADELDRYAPLAALHAAVLGSAAGARPVVTDDQRLRLLDDIADALEGRAQTAPVAVLVDDAHWADPATLFALRTLPARLSASRVLWALAIRPEGGRPIAERTRETLERQGALRLAVGPLPPDELHRIATDVLGTAPAPALSRWLRGAGGNPFLAIELLRALVDTDALSTAAGTAGPVREDIPAGFRRSVEVRLRRLPEEALRLLQVGSVLGREFDLATAARMLGRPVGGLLSAVDDLLDADLLAAGGRLAFRHDLMRQAVYDGLPPAVRSALHREAGDILRDGGGRAADVAWHVVLAGGPVDDASVRALHETVRELASAAPEAAADLAQKAAGLLPAHDERRVELLTEAAEQLGWTRRVHEALELVDATISGGLRPAQEAALRLVAAEIHQAAGDDAAAMTHLSRALTLPGLSSELSTRLLKTKATGHVYLGDIAAAERNTGLVEAAYRSEDPSVLVSVMVFQSQTSFYRGRLARALDLAERAAGRADAEPDVLRLRPPRIPALWLATVLASTDRLADAERVLRDGQREAEALGLGWSLPYWHASRSTVLLERGALDDAAVEAEACLTVSDALEITRAIPLARSVLATISVHRGDLARAEEQLRSAEADSGPGGSPYGPWVALGRARLADAEGRPTAAAAALRAVYGSGDPARLLALPPAQWPYVVRLALRGGDRETAEVVADAARRLVRTDDSQHVVRAVRAHMDGLLHRDRAALSAAVAGHRRGIRRLALASASEDLGALLAAAGDTGPAAPYLEEAAQLASAAGAVRDLERIRHRLREAGVRSGAALRRPAATSGWESLTESELKVVPLVVDGLTNRAIADRLYLSVHTVNTHLKHVFSKLGINTRVELTRLAIQQQRQGSPG
ncbi:regulatory protein, luxR family [Streptomyces sp. DvalAA-14]|uniref:ATP-binding protein n=1 Tax=unclassified Streptomyces TaxID=2593676 RepID=UPI00081BC332|nr:MULTISPECIES: LuxR family transcriptional regulator [unclassified Streptomyces]MYS22018.1 AAA family ATPase [Streptomyces sp. SID4948]SCE06847.1 regulatory protein, luxR family [Streptomyces sp. DvalAA-14]